MASHDFVNECNLLCAGYRYFALENGHECRCGNMCVPPPLCDI